MTAPDLTDRDLNAMPEGERVVAGPTRTVWTKAGQWTNGEEIVSSATLVGALSPVVPEQD